MAPLLQQATVLAVTYFIIENGEYQAFKTHREVCRLSSVFSPPRDQSLHAYSSLAAADEMLEGPVRGRFRESIGRVVATVDPAVLIQLAVLGGP